MSEARTTLKMPENLPNHSELRRMMKITGPLMFQTPKKSRLIIWYAGKRNKPVSTGTASKPIV